MRGDYVNVVTVGIFLLQLLKVTVMLLLCSTLICLRGTGDFSDGPQIQSLVLLCNHSEYNNAQHKNNLGVPLPRI